MSWSNTTDIKWMLRQCRQREVPDNIMRAFAAYVAEFTPLGDGRTTWDLLTDERSRHAIRVASWHAHGLATQEELAAAWRDAWHAAHDVSFVDKQYEVAVTAAKAAGGHVISAILFMPLGGHSWRADALRLHIPDITKYPLRKVLK